MEAGQTIWIGVRALISTVILAFVFLFGYFSVTRLGGLGLEFIAIVAFSLLLIFPMWLGELSRNPRTRGIAVRLIFTIGASTMGWMAFRSLTAAHPQVCSGSSRAAAGCALENAIFAVAGIPGVFTFYAAIALLFVVALVWPARSTRQA